MAAPTDTENSGMKEYLLLSDNPSLIDATMTNVYLVARRATRYPKTLDKRHSGLFGECTKNWTFRNKITGRGGLFTNIRNTSTGMSVKSRLTVTKAVSKLNLDLDQGITELQPCCIGADDLCFSRNITRRDWAKRHNASRSTFETMQRETRDAWQVSVIYWLSPTATLRCCPWSTRKNTNRAGPWAPPRTPSLIPRPSAKRSDRVREKESWAEPMPRPATSIYWLKKT